MIRKNFMTNAIFHVTICFKNGMHKIIRCRQATVAKITAAFRECKKNIFASTERWYLVIPGYGLLNISEIKECKFTNESTKEEFLTLA